MQNAPVRRGPERSGEVFGPVRRMRAISRSCAADAVQSARQGDWCIGNTVVSKTATRGSTPRSPAPDPARRPLGARDAGGGTRTPKDVSPPAPKTGASANSATPAERVSAAEQRELLHFR